MSEIVALVVVAGLAVGGGLAYWQPWNKPLYFPSGQVPLNKRQLYEFTFVGSFVDETAARATAQVQLLPDIETSVSPWDKAKGWYVNWRLTCRADGNRVRSLQRQIEGVIAQHGGRYAFGFVGAPRAKSSVAA